MPKLTPIHTHFHGENKEDKSISKVTILLVTRHSKTQLFHAPFSAPDNTARHSAVTSHGFKFHLQTIFHYLHCTHGGLYCKYSDPLTPINLSINLPVCLKL